MLKNNYKLMRKPFVLAGSTNYNKIAREHEAQVINAKKVADQQEKTKLLPIDELRAKRIAAFKATK